AGFGNEGCDREARQSRRDLARHHAVARWGAGCIRWPRRHARGRSRRRELAHLTPSRGACDDGSCVGRVPDELHSPAELDCRASRAHQVVEVAEPRWVSSRIPCNEVLMGRRGVRVFLAALVLALPGVVRAQTPTHETWSVEGDVGWDFPVSGNILSAAIGRVFDQATVIDSQSYADIYGP